MEGSFNEYGARALIKAIVDKIEKFNGEPFSIIVEDLQLEGITPEGYEELNKYNEWLNGQNMIAKARVANSAVILNIDSVRIPTVKKQKIKEFNNVPDAIEWLKLQP